ncbi:PH domain-containing protein [Actinocorallia sp. A-T 12471]|uniref:PH domain-containing protein n=1 Tax=Actinocorallia sp. A-T 12471 TaxID=3089813 RepID=UPI0029D40605|nr:PH domain-containing protein [Actinocorallia sp. A-T 12471]MDX6743288.1 PH domain-containing protein [Actinocorallia sp. A-T 12471]
MGFNDVMVVRDKSRSRTIRHYLMEDEEQVIAVRRHPASLLRPVAEVFGGLILAGVLSGWLGGGVATLVVWLAWLYLVARLIWRVLTWSVEFFIVTERRLMYIQGLIARRVGMIPLKKVTDIKLERPLQGQFLDYGTFIMESAGDDQAFREVTYMPYPEQLYFDVSSMIFPSLDDAGD